MARGSGILGPLRERDFALLWFGQAVSMVGDGIFTVTIALQALAISPSPGALASVLAARSLPRVLFLVFAGVVSDRLPRRWTAIASDVARGVAVSVIAILAAAGSLELWHLIVMAVVFGTADAFFLPTLTAIVPEILPADLLVAGSGLNASSRHLFEQLLGPAFGGILVGALGTSWAFGLDAASFAVSAACIAAMRARPAATLTSDASVLADAREGLRYTRSIRWLWVSILAAGFGNFVAFSTLPVLLPLLVRRELHAGAADLGFVYAGFGAGGLLAAVVAGRRGVPRRRVLAMWGAWASSGVLIIAIALSGTLASSIGLAAGCAFLLEYGNVLWTPLLQERVPARLLGRVSSVDWLFSLSLTPLGIAAAGPVAGAIGVRATMVAGGSLAACLALVLLIPGVRDPERA